MWKGIIIAEGLEEPSVINEFDVYKARISKQDEFIDGPGKQRKMAPLLGTSDRQTGRNTNEPD